MCGICGFAGGGSLDDLKAMTTALAHRGPDASGYWVDSERRLFLGHRRLSIIDIEGGAQPMSDAAGGIVVVFNGEIYNHNELRRELQGRGRRFLTDHSDTEVLVHGFAEWGEDLPKHLNGMFAFAAYDRQRGVLFLARDRFGEKPLYYATEPGGFIFASELNALRLFPGLEGEVDRAALRKLFAYGFLPAPLTIYRNLRKIPAGGSLTYELAGRRLVERSYWRFAVEPQEPVRSDAELAEELRELLSESVRRRLMSDVPLGIFLSGGIDSSAVLAMAARHREPAGLDSFAIGFREPSYDESRFAQVVAEHVGSRHHCEVLSLEGARSLMPGILGRLDEPIADPSIVPTWLLSRFARRTVTVALSGDGGDELFAGYDPFAALAPAAWYRALVPGPLHRGLKRLVEFLPRSSANMSLDFKLRRTLRGLSYPPEYWNPAWLGPLEPAEISDLMHERVAAEDLYSEAIAAWRGAASADPVDRTLEFYTRFYLQDDILAKVDRASMMHSLEVRAPFLDNDLVEFARRLPSRYKMRSGQRKFLLKEALRPSLPAGIIDRSKKGFGIPLSDWMKHLRPPCGRRIPFIAQDAWEQRWAAHRSGKADYRQLLWCGHVLQHHFQQAH